MELRKHLDLHSVTHSGIRALKVPFQVKVGQNHPKTTFFMFLHQTRATQ